MSITPTGKDLPKDAYQFALVYTLGHREGYRIYALQCHTHASRAYRLYLASSIISTHVDKGFLVHPKIRHLDMDKITESIVEVPVVRPEMKSLEAFYWTLIEYQPDTVPPSHMNHIEINQRDFYWQRYVNRAQLGNKIKRIMLYVDTKSFVVPGGCYGNLSRTITEFVDVFRDMQKTRQFPEWFEEFKFPITVKADGEPEIVIFFLNLAALSKPTRSDEPTGNSRANNQEMLCRQILRDANGEPILTAASTYRYIYQRNCTTRRVYLRCRLLRLRIRRAIRERARLARQ